MNKYLKISLVASAGLVGLIVLLAATVALTVNPNDYKPQIVKLVQEKKQRTLNLAGNIRLTLFPKLGVDLGKASLSEHQSNREFAAVDSIRFYLAWLPLLRKELVIDQVRVDGLRANLVRYKDGTTNFDDLLKKEEPSQFKFDIDGARVANANVIFTDEQTGRRLTLSKLELKTGRLSNGRPTELSGTFHLHADKPAIDSDIKLNSGLLFDTEAKRYALKGLDLEATGTGVGITNLAMGVKGDMDADIAKGAYSLTSLAVGLAGKRGDGELDFRLTVPKLQTVQDRTTVGRITAVLKLLQPEGKLNAALDIPAMGGMTNALSTDKLTLSINGQQGETMFNTKLVSPLHANLSAKRFDFARLAGPLTLAGPRLASAVRANLTGTAHADLEKQEVRLDTSSRMEDTSIQGKFGMRRFDAPLYTFDIDIDRLDLDRYLTPAEKPREKPLDFSALKTLNANGSLRIGFLKVSNIKSTNVRLDVRTSNDKLESARSPR